MSHTQEQWDRWVEDKRRQDEMTRARVVADRGFINSDVWWAMHGQISGQKLAIERLNREVEVANKKAETWERTARQMMLTPMPGVGFWLGLGAVVGVAASAIISYLT
jgi:hypothetical protein